MEIIKNILNQKYDNHILPFVWLHGESEETIIEYIKKISESGIGAVCLESRPHPDFLGKKWWDDVEIIINECKKRGMKIWFFDDQHFPTGYAGGALQKPENKHLSKMFLNESQLDFVGPMQDTAITVKWAGGNRQQTMSVGVENDLQDSTSVVKNTILAVYAAPKTEYKKVNENHIINLTKYVIDGVLYWDIPEGEWTIKTIYSTYDGGEEATAGYLNPLISESTDLLLNNVYQKHYDHFGEEFGETIAGFFSDEPRFGNVKGPNAIIGRLDMPLPWFNGLEKLLAKKQTNLNE